MKTEKKFFIRILSFVLTLGTVTFGSSNLTSFAIDDSVKMAENSYCNEKLDIASETNDVFSGEEAELVSVSKTLSSINTPTGETAVKVTNSEMEVTVEYKETKYFDFETYNMPQGATVHVYHNGEDKGEGTFIGIYDPTEDYTVEAKIIDKDGNEIATSGEIKVKVKNGFFDRLKESFKETTRTFVDGFLDVVSAILLNIWIILRGGIK